MTAIFGCVPFYRAYSFELTPYHLSLLSLSNPESTYIYHSTYHLATWIIIFSAVKNPTSSCKRPLWSLYRRQMRSFSPRYDVSPRYVVDILTIREIFQFFSPAKNLFDKAPIAWPISKLLDRILSTEHHTYKKAELKSFLQFHRTGDEPLRNHEITILNGVLELNTKKVETIMTPLQVCLSINCFYSILI